ncbi:MAG: hypothetical protein ACI3U2_08630 [Anaerovibrio sp.]
MMLFKRILHFTGRICCLAVLLVLLSGSCQLAGAAEAVNPIGMGAVADGEAAAVDNAGENAGQQVVRQSVGIVLLGNPRYLQPEYMDILNRYFVRCYSQYRYPTEFGAGMQESFAAACNEVYAGAGADVATGKNSRRVKFSQLDFPALAGAMHKDKVLFLNVRDVLTSSWHRIAWDVGADEFWEATVEVEAVLADRNGILRREKVMRRISEQYTPTVALQEAYTYCIRYMQKKDFFPAAALQ